MQNRKSMVEVPQLRYAPVCTPRHQPTILSNGNPPSSERAGKSVHAFVMGSANEPPTIAVSIVIDVFRSVV